MPRPFEESFKDKLLTGSAWDHQSIQVNIRIPHINIHNVPDNWRIIDCELVPFSNNVEDLSDTGYRYTQGADNSPNLRRSREARLDRRSSLKLMQKELHNMTS